MAQAGQFDERTYTGKVKWFDSARGFGFVVVPDVPRDILLHANVLRNFGQNSISDRSRITLLAVETDRGIQAQEVIAIEPPDIDEDVEEPQSALPFDETLRGGPLEAARVKWFDAAKGFGFANVFGLGEDVFIHVEVLRRSSLADLQPGEAIALRVAEGSRGKLATQVSVWESGITQSQAETVWHGSEAAE